MANNMLLEQILEMEKMFTGENHNGIEIGTECRYSWLKGTQPILISAMVGVKHQRIKNGELVDKKAHLYTAALAANMYISNGSYALLKNKHSEEDLQDGINVSYKEKLLDIINKENICFFIDLRGQIENQIADIIIGDDELEYIYGNTKFREETKKMFSYYGMSVAFNKTCQAKKSVAPANFVFKNTGVPSVQLLISASLRDPRHKLNRYLELEHALIDYSDLCLKYFREKEQNPTMK